MPAHDGHLSPCADPHANAPGWQIATPSRRLAVAATVAGGTVRSGGTGEWQARLPGAVLAVVAIGADTDAGVLWCRLGAAPGLGVFTLTFAPWPAAIVLRCPLTGFPAHGRLSVREVRVTTRMGRTVRYLVPAFTTA
jgi:hypothetical protein